uniref:Uncharacterized protein n=1 Tax=Siphoviridae sp. ctGkF2 TaxID=2827823 RepID=A0A8S5TKZ3_9CAUD|nr:MAG TPA: hypothetical protein [Siphoviridae sp. ctGkF2]
MSTARLVSQVVRLDWFASGARHNTTTRKV